MKYFHIDTIIPQILNLFKINNLVISGIKDDELLNSIFNYDASCTQINTNVNGCIKDNPLNVLLKLENYDAIFINDDPNWYTVFNELNIVKKTNDEFPLVFICNNIFPNKRRDSYLNPDIIPVDFRQKYSNKLSICYNDKKINISDGFYHACDENTPKNGVLTAIEDFMKENSHIGMIKIGFFEEISILYLKSQINQKRVSIIKKNMEKNNFIECNLSDKLIENQLLLSYINEYELYDDNLNELKVQISKKDSIIEDYENRLRTQNNQMAIKDAKLNGIESNLDLKDLQIKDIESKLVNRDNKINKLENQLKIANDEAFSLNQENDEFGKKINRLENQLKIANDEAFSLNQENDEFGKKINRLENQLNSTNNDLNSLNNQLNGFKQRECDYVGQIDLLNNEIIHKDENLINYQEQIKIKNNQINSLKIDLTKKESYFRNNENELKNQISINNNNIKQKDTQIKNQQNKLNEKNKHISCLEHSYTKQLSKIDAAEYCILCFKEEISNNDVEIKYLKNNALPKKLFSPLAYVYLILKSNPKEISLNIKLYKVLKDSNCFDIGFYLNNNEDLLESIWCKYFSPELHYVCHGFYEKRTFNKKYFVRDSKKALFEYLLKCDG